MPEEPLDDILVFTLYAATTLALGFKIILIVFDGTDPYLNQVLSNVRSSYKVY